MCNLKQGHPLCLADADDLVSNSLPLLLQNAEVWKLARVKERTRAHQGVPEKALEEHLLVAIVEALRKERGLLWTRSDFGEFPSKCTLCIEGLETRFTMGKTCPRDAPR